MTLDRRRFLLTVTGALASPTFSSAATAQTQSEIKKTQALAKSVYLFITKQAFKDTYTDRSQFESIETEQDLDSLLESKRDTYQSNVAKATVDCFKELKVTEAEKKALYKMLTDDGRYGILNRFNNEDNRDFSRNRDGIALDKVNPFYGVLRGLRDKGTAKFSDDVYYDLVSAVHEEMAALPTVIKNNVPAPGAKIQKAGPKAASQ